MIICAEDSDYSVMLYYDIIILGLRFALLPSLGRGSEDTENGITS